MIIRCIHLREIGLIKHACCSHCHGPAGCVGQTLPNGHQAIYYCARTESFTSEEIEAILANIPRWESMLSNPRYHKKLRLEHQKARSWLRRIEDLMADANIESDDKGEEET